MDRTPTTNDSEPTTQIDYDRLNGSDERNETILLVGDEAGVREMLCGWLGETMREHDSAIVITTTEAASRTVGETFVESEEVLRKNLGVVNVSAEQEIFPAGFKRSPRYQTASISDLVDIRLRVSDMAEFLRREYPNDQHLGIYDIDRLIRDVGLERVVRLVQAISSMDLQSPGRILLGLPSEEVDGEAFDRLSESVDRTVTVDTGR